MAPTDQSALARARVRSADRSQGDAAITRLARLGPIVAGYGLPFLIIVYLALNGGGYDSVVRSQVGIAAWWIVLTGALVGALPATRVTRVGAVAVGLLLVFGLWTAIGISWSESAERSVAEVGRVAAYLGVFALATLAQGRESLRRTIWGIAAAIGLIGSLAVLSRLQPELFPPNETARLLPAVQPRLSFPVDYWNAVATLVAIGIPLTLTIATQARSTVGRCLAIGVMPVLVLTAFFTLSRGGAIEIAIALLVVFALYPRRLALLVSGVVGALGSIVLVFAASRLDALEAGLSTATAMEQGDQLSVVLVISCAGTALLFSALVIAEKRGLTPSFEVSRTTTAVAWASSAAAAVLIALAAGAGGFVGDRVEEFRTPEPEVNDSAARFESFSGTGRYNLWASAVSAGESDPVIGIGPGSFEFWWARDTEFNTAFSRDAHSLYLETFGELGLIGVFVLLLFIISTTVAGLVRLLRSRERTHRGLMAAGLAAVAVFLTSAAVDWMWEIPVLPVIWLLILAALLGPSAAPARARYFASGSRTLPRVAFAALGAIAILVITIPLTAELLTRQSQASVRSGSIATAIESASEATAVQPYAGDAELQLAQVLELDDQLPAAVQAARRATANEPTNWRNWLVLSRLEAKADNVPASVEAYRRARALNPNSTLFQPDAAQ